MRTYFYSDMDGWIFTVKAESRAVANKLAREEQPYGPINFIKVA